MNKLKSIFKKDKDTDYESSSASTGRTSADMTSGGRSSSGMQSSGMQSGQSSGMQSGGMQSSGMQSGQSSGMQSGGMQSRDVQSGGMQSGGMQSSGLQSGGMQSGGMQSGGMQSGGMQSGGMQSGGMQSRDMQSGGMQHGGQAQAAPTGSAFPSNTAPSTGMENADNAEGVVMHTTLGDIIIALFSQQCPRTCKNFATLAASGKYDNVVFHRIIPGFMIQGGDPDGTGRGGRSIYGGKFEDEFVSELRHTGKGILSMANSGPNTNGSQFFICLAATPHLDGKHTVFGQVADGMDVVDRLGSVRTGQQDRPVEEVKILRCDVF